MEAKRPDGMSGLLIFKHWKNYWPPKTRKSTKTGFSVSRLFVFFVAKRNPAKLPMSGRG
jgi:hypothetical protein